MRKISLTLIFSIVTLHAMSQDPQFSQYYQAPLYLNPGFTGITKGQRLIVNHRLQWPNLPQAFSTYAASYDVFLQDINSGIGVQFMSDKMGSANWKSTSASLHYSYKIRLTDKLVFSPGLSFGFGTNGLDRSQLRMGDALAYGASSLDPKLDHVEGQRYMDFGSGLVLYTKQLWLGASFMHMNRPNVSFLGEDNRLGMKSSVHGGMRFDISNRLRPGRTVYFTPSFVYRVQGKTFSQLDVGANFHVDPVSVGIWYRGKPFSKGVNSAVEQDALILFMGLYLKDLTVGYSYDFTISSLHNGSGGSHEVSLIYEFVKKKHKPRKQKLIPCPAFYGKQGFR